MLFNCNVIDRLCFAQSDMDLLFDKVDSMDATSNMSSVVGQLCAAADNDESQLLSPDNLTCVLDFSASALDYS
jgi:hypothetical protein